MSGLQDKNLVRITRSPINEDFPSPRYPDTSPVNEDWFLHVETIGIDHRHLQHKNSPR